MSTDGTLKDWSEDGSNGEGVISARLDAIAEGLQGVHTTIDVVLAQEGELLTRAEAVCGDVAKQQDEFAAVLVEAHSVVGELDTTLTTLSGALNDLDDACAGIHECTERARRV